MIDTTSRRDRRSSTRLDQLISQATGGPPPRRDVSPDDPPPPWEPASWPPDPPDSPDLRDDPPTRIPPRRDGEPPPSAHEHPGSGPPLADPRSTGLPTEGWPVATPWWRRTANRLLERWLPERAADPPRRRLAVFVAGGALLGVAVAVGFALSGTRDQPEMPPALPAASVSEVRNPDGTPDQGESSIVISVIGRVATPGLVTLPDGARVADALKAAGGPVPGVDLGGLNLARRLTDGEQIYVAIPAPAPAPAGAEPGAPGAGGQPGTARVDLNSASMAALDTLPGVGPVTAQRILDWRTEHGRFASVDQLREIEGIGPARFAKLKDLVVAG